MTKVTYLPKPRYENPMADRLGLRQDDIKREAKLARLLEDLQGKIRTLIPHDVDWRFAEAENIGALPLPKHWREWPILTQRSVWGYHAETHVACRRNHDSARGCGWHLCTKLHVELAHYAGVDRPAMPCLSRW